MTDYQTARIEAASKAVLVMWKKYNRDPALFHSTEYAKTCLEAADAVPMPQDDDSAMVERVARAIWEVLDCKEEGRERLKVYAKAAISAINQGDK